LNSFWPMVLVNSFHYALEQKRQFDTIKLGGVFALSDDLAVVLPLLWSLLRYWPWNPGWTDTFVNTFLFDWYYWVRYLFCQHYYEPYC
jgi:hypothetical protein